MRRLLTERVNNWLGVTQSASGGASICHPYPHPGTLAPEPTPHFHHDYIQNPNMFIPPAQYDPFLESALRM